MSHSHDLPSSPESDDIDAEARHFRSVVNAFQKYALSLAPKIGKTEFDFSTIDPALQSLVPGFNSRMSVVKKCVLENQAILDAIVADSGHLFVNQSPELDGAISQHEGVLDRDVDKVRSTLKSLMREWSADGADERRACYQPFIEELCLRFPDCNSRAGVSVLTPGCGLGRLPWELVSQGFISQGNEFSFFMLLASNFVLNSDFRAIGINGAQIHPFVHEFNNILSVSDQTRAVSFPDIDPSSLPPNSNFSMAAGEFIQVYGTQFAAWDAVCSCFFLDTAHNVLDYLRTVSNILKPGGFLLNLGPLLYHYADMDNQLSIDLTYEELRQTFPYFGLRLIREDLNVPCSYARNACSMLQMEYRCVSFTCVKDDTVRVGLAARPPSLVPVVELRHWESGVNGVEDQD